MGTSLTGLTPATTYDALIKVGDNGPLSATAKYLSDGLGNDSVLALSTARVGIGTASPDLTLHLYSAAAALSYFESTNANGAYVIWRNSGTSIGDVGSQLGISGTGSASNFMIASRSGDLILGSSSAERMRITSAGNVGIGTSSPNGTLTVRTSGTNTGLELGTEVAGASILSYDRAATTYKKVFIRGSIIEFNPNDINRVTVTADGLTFNGDTAAANALDDYEEGTFTATLTPSTSGTIVLSPSTCSYTKIGRQVTVRGQVVVSAKSSPVGSITILGGLPFTSENSVSSRGAGIFQYFPSVGSGSLLQNYQLQNSVEVNLILDASTIGAGAEFYVSLTYFV